MGTEEERLNAYHRKQLKKILNIRYPKKINKLPNEMKKSLHRICQKKPLSLQSYRLARVSLVILYEETKTFLQIKQKEFKIIPNGNKLRGRPKTNLPIVLIRDRTDSTPNQTTPKQRPDRYHRTVTGQVMLERINITNRESCRRELGHATAISQ